MSQSSNKARSFLLLVSLLVLGVSAMVEGAETVDALQSELMKTASGRALMTDLENVYGSTGSVGLRVFLSILESEASDFSGRLLDASDPGLLVVAQSLRKIPRRLREDSLVTAMALFDGWVAASVDRALGERVIDTLNDSRWSRDADIRRQQLGEQFPFLFGQARMILIQVGIEIKIGNE